MTADSGPRIGGRPCELGALVGYGAVSQVYELGGDRVAKIYREPDPARTARLENMLAAFRPADFVQTATGHALCVWPEQLITDAAGAVIGYAMRRVDGPPLSTLFEHGSRLRAFPDKDWRFLLAVATNLAQTIRVLHDYDIVVGDLAPSNVHVGPTGLVSLLDSDSLQFRHDGELFPCDTLTLDYSAPQLVREGAGEKTFATDRFSLAVIVCQLLLVGDHPFQGFPTEELEAEPSPETNIIYGITALTNPRAVELPDDAIDLAVLPGPVRELARQAFGGGHSNPESRPAAEEWFAALDEAYGSVRTCWRQPSHAYLVSQEDCPWCARARAGYFDPFPALAPAAAPVPLPPAPPPAVPPAPVLPPVPRVPSGSSARTAPRGRVAGRGAAPTPRPPGPPSGASNRTRVYVLLLTIILALVIVAMIAAL